MPKIDPDTYLTHADLSRADLRVLSHFCSGANVVEFGVGGSTLFLEQIAQKLTSYETSQDWIALVQGKLVNSSRVSLIQCANVPPNLPKADVYFIDGTGHLRPEWVHQCIDQRLARTIIVHDSRRLNPIGSLTWLITWPHTAIIEKVEYHFMESNCVVITLRDTPVVYENWNVTEPLNRLPHLSVKK